MPAELRLHRLGDLARLERKRGGREFRHHLVLGEEAEIAAIGGAGVLGLLLGQLSEIGALLQLLDDGLGLVLGLEQDVAGVHFLVAGDLLGGLLIDLLHRLIGGGGLALGGQQLIHQDAVAGEIEPALEIGPLGDLLVLGGLGDDLHVDQERQHIFPLGGGVHLGEVRGQFLFSQSDVVLADFDAVNLGEYRIGILSTNRRPSQQQAAGHSRSGEAKARAEFLVECQSGHGYSLKMKVEPTGGGQSRN